MLKIKNISVESAEKAAPAEGWVISSESCGFLSIGARYEREVSYFNQCYVYFCISKTKCNSRLSRVKLLKLLDMELEQLILLNDQIRKNRHFVYLNMYILLDPIQFSKDKWCIQFDYNVGENWLVKRVLKRT